MIDWKQTTEFKLFGDVWNFYKMYHSISQDSRDDSKWGVMIEEANGIIHKYNDSKFATDLVESVLNQIERRSKGVM
jgi:hypothetical protein